MKAIVVATGLATLAIAVLIYASQHKTPPHREAGVSAQVSVPDAGPARQQTPVVPFDLVDSNPAAPASGAVPAGAPAKASNSSKAAQAGTAPPKPVKTKPPIQDPEARDALALVGNDPYAEAYWVAAINNPTLSAHERQDLIEDLNEDGLSDPKHPGPEDLPLIVSRIELIEELAPFAMDQVNADAFAEAYKDLWNMFDRLQGR